MHDLANYFAPLDSTGVDAVSNRQLVLGANGTTVIKNNKISCRPAIGGLPHAPFTRRRSFEANRDWNVETWRDFLTSYTVITRFRWLNFPCCKRVWLGKKRMAMFRPTTKWL